jgi:hypothetical protein
LDVLLDAARRLATEWGIKVLLAGEGPMKNQLMKTYGDLPNVRFLTDLVLCEALSMYKLKQNIGSDVFVRVKIGMAESF